MEGDLLYDLFGNDGFLTPKSSGSEQDSGHGSPFDSPFNNSPTPSSFTWEDDHGVGDLWGSILDDLPADFTDADSDGSSSEPKNDANTAAPMNSSDALCWSSKEVTDGNDLDFVNNAMNFEVGDWNLNGNVFGETGEQMVATGEISPEMALPDASFLPPQTINFLPDPTTPIIESPLTFAPETPDSLSPDSLSPESLTHDSLSPVSLPPENDMVEEELAVNNQYSKRDATSTPISSKPITAIKAPTWVLKTGSGELKSSHFQLGQSIIAIIQNVQQNNAAAASPDSEETIDVETISSPMSDDLEYTGNDVQQFQSTKVHHVDHDYADIDMSYHQSGTTTGVSQGVGPGLKLTDEEKKLLDLEGLRIPEDAPLTKEEEKNLKKVRRKIKNKQSAMESRRKRKEYIDNLERRVKHCTDINTGLRKKVDKLSEENKSLASQLKAMKDFIGSFQDSRTPTKGTFLAVLVLSFAFFVLPFNPMYYFTDGKTQATGTHSDHADPTPMWRSRSLLGVVDDNTEYHYQDETVNSTFPPWTNKGIPQQPQSSAVAIYQPSDENLQVHFESGRGSGPKWNSSLLVYQNLTWFTSVNDVHGNESNYVTF